MALFYCSLPGTTAPKNYFHRNQRLDVHCGDCFNIKPVALPFNPFNY
jgi:hypothetical protein